MIFWAVMRVRVSFVRHVCMDSCASERGGHVMQELRFQEVKVLQTLTEVERGCLLVLFLGELEWRRDWRGWEVSGRCRNGDRGTDSSSERCGFEREGRIIAVHGSGDKVMGLPENFTRWWDRARHRKCSSWIKQTSSWTLGVTRVFPSILNNGYRWWWL